VEGLATGEANLQTWWTGLGDPILEDLIRRAQESNLGLREALARIGEARAVLGVASGQYWPGADASGAVSRQDLSDNSALGQALPGTFDPTSLYDVGIDASWEIDVFGRIRRSVESAGAGYEAAIEDYRDVLVTLLAEVALSYTEVREFQARIQYAEANVENQRATRQMTRDRHEGGAVSELDVAQAESNLKNTEAGIPALEIALNTSLNRLAVLLGLPPGAVHEELAAANVLPFPPESLTAGIPADLMRQRPDIRRAERLLASQTARIGVAKADLYPRFSLSGFFAVEAGEGGDLFSSASRTWGISLPFRWLLFDGGRVRSAVQAEEARTEQALVRYERSVLLALEDVENALTAYSLERNRRDRLAEATIATERAVELVQTQYKEGLTDFQNVLDMERSLTAQQDQLAASESAVIKNLIVLYKALGGGWDPNAGTPDTETTPPATS
jgi:NodT family efflux transporter outer membrane factor (OMF) lipoprotein